MSPNVSTPPPTSTSTSTSTKHSVNIGVIGSNNSGSLPGSSNVSNLNPQNNQRYRYQNEIQSMMYTFGDARHPLSSTSLLIEDIVHCQIIELLVKVSGIVLRRGARSIAPEDLLFLLRRDVNRSARLKEFLSWKDVRKNAKATGGSEGKGSGDNSIGGSVGGGDDSALVEEIEEDAKNLAASESNSLQFDDPSNEYDSSASKSTRNNQLNPSSNVQIGPKRRQLGLFWDLGHGLLADLPGSSGLNDIGSLTSYDSRDQSTCQRETLRRLRQADLVTLSMSQSEYLEYSECRQASFTFKKARKFREWLVGGTARPGSLALASLAGGSARELSRLNDDTLEILGFLAYEIVQKLTEVSLAAKFEQEMIQEQKERLEKQSKANSNNNNNTSTLGGIFTGGPQSTNQQIHAPINPPDTCTKTPIQVCHVEEAYRKLISSNIDGFNLFKRNLNKKRKFIL